MLKTSWHQQGCIGIAVNLLAVLLTVTTSDGRLCGKKKLWNCLIKRWQPTYALSVKTSFIKQLFSTLNWLRHLPLISAAFPGDGWLSPVLAITVCWNKGDCVVLTSGCDGLKAAETCTICSEPAIENIMECAWCEYKRHSTCLGISVKHFFRCCTLLFMLLTPPMQSYENQTRDNEKLQMVKQNFNQTLDALEHKITEVIKSIESQLGKHHKSLSITTYQHIHNI